jgi:hypothetical protein
MADGLLHPRSFARGWAALLVVLVVAGVATALAGRPRLLPGFLEFDWTHTALHIVLLGLALYYGWFAQPSSTRTYAQVFGLGGLVVAVVGFVPAAADGVHDATGWHFELGENLVHGLLGVWGTVSGFRRPA